MCIRACVCVCVHMCMCGHALGGLSLSLSLSFSLGGDQKARAGVSLFLSPLQLHPALRPMLCKDTDREKHG